MKEQIPQPAPVSRTLQGKTCEANTASVINVLQAYKKDISQRREIDEDELLQGKFEPAQRERLGDDDALLQGKFETIQRDELDEDELLQGKFETAQRDELEDDELLQGKFEPTQRQETPNNTGLPDNLKAGVEQLSGLDMSDIKVHYNSSKPASVQAHAYTQGTDIHVAPGQEKHLGHESWHVAQQKQGRVQPTTTVAGMAVNDNVGLENEADVMGGKAVQMKTKEKNSVAQKKSDGKQGFGFADNRPVSLLQRKWQKLANSHVIQQKSNKTSQIQKFMQFQRFAEQYNDNEANLKNTHLSKGNRVAQLHWKDTTGKLTSKYLVPTGGGSSPKMERPKKPDSIKVCEGALVTPKNPLGTGTSNHNIDWAEIKSDLIAAIITPDVTILQKYAICLGIAVPTELDDNTKLTSLQNPTPTNCPQARLDALDGFIEKACWEPRNLFAGPLPEHRPMDPAQIKSNSDTFDYHCTASGTVTPKSQVWKEMREDSSLGKSIGKSIGKLNQVDVSALLAKLQAISDVQSAFDEHQWWKVKEDFHQKGDPRAWSAFETNQGSMQVASTAYTASKQSYISIYTMIYGDNKTLLFNHTPANSGTHPETELAAWKGQYDIQKALLDVQKNTIDADITSLNKKINDICLKFDRGIPPLPVVSGGLNKQKNDLEIQFNALYDELKDMPFAKIRYPKDNDTIQSEEYSINIEANAVTNNVEVLIQNKGNQTRQTSDGTWWYDWHDIQNGSYEIQPIAWNKEGKTFKGNKAKIAKK